MKKTILISAILFAVLVAGLIFLRVKAKSFSPESNVDFIDGNLKVHVFYNRPYKKGREIFGKLVPYGKPWRTGANEPTVFETNQDLSFGDKKLKAGKYSLWTVPEEQNWQIIFNSSVPWWGINFNGETLRDPAADALVLEAQVHHPQDKVFEQFTISIEKSNDGMELVLFWDNTVVAVPFNSK